MTVSRSGARWDGYELDPLLLGGYEVESSLKPSKETKVTVGFDPETSVPYNEYKSVISEMVGYTYRYAQLHATFMAGLAAALEKGVQIVMALKKGIAAPNDEESTWVSSNLDGLNHKDKVTRFGF